MVMFDELHEEFRQSVARMVQQHIVPIADEVDQTNRFPEELLEVFADMGLIQLAVPQEYGGPGGDLTATCIAREEIAKGGLTGLGQLGGQTGVFVQPLLAFGTEEQRQRFLPELAKGHALTCLAMSEPHAGSDAAAMTTRAVKDGSSWVINGQKCFITWGSVATYSLVMARTSDRPRGEGISAFIVDTSTPGFVVGRHDRKMGQHGVPNVELFFEDLRVPEENMLGEEGTGFRLALRSLHVNRPTIAAMGIGGAQAALDYAIAYCNSRMVRGRPVSSYQGLRWMIAEAATELEAARCLVYECARQFDSGQVSRDEIGTISSMAKAFAADVVMKVTTNCVQFLGGHGYMQDHPVERLFRDAKLIAILEGTTEIQKEVIARGVID